MVDRIAVPVWWRRHDGLHIRRDALEADHPENTYNYIKRTYDIDPELFGIHKEPTKLAVWTSDVDMNEMSYHK